MTVSTRPKNAYPCGCPKHETETLQRTRNGVSTLVVHRLIGTHDPRQPHPPRLPVHAWATDAWPVRA
jgi:hypothetical protein